MSDISAAQAKQETAQTAAEVFAPLEKDAVDSLKFWLSPAGRSFDPKANLDATKYVLDKRYGKTPDQSTGQEPPWVKVIKRAVKIDGVSVGDLVNKASADGGTLSGEIEETIFYFGPEEQR